MLVPGHSQVIGGPIVVTGNSLVEMSPWADSGIVPKPTIRGWNGHTCEMLTSLLPWDVAPGAKTAVLVEATDDVLRYVSPEDHKACMVGQIEWLLANRPGIKIYVANTPPMAEENCYGDYREQIEAYNAVYDQLASDYPVTLVDVWSGIVQADGWAIPDDMDGPCGIHFGQPGQLNPGWAFFMGSVKDAIY